MSTGQHGETVLGTRILKELGPLANAVLLAKGFGFVNRSPPQNINTPLPRCANPQFMLANILFDYQEVDADASCLLASGSSKQTNAYSVQYTIVVSIFFSIIPNITPIYYSSFHFEPLASLP